MTVLWLFSHSLPSYSSFTPARFGSGTAFLVKGRFSHLPVYDFYLYLI